MLLLLTEEEVHFCLELVENPVSIVALAECHMDVLVFFCSINCWLEQTDQDLCESVL